MTMRLIRAIGIILIIIGIITFAYQGFSYTSNEKVVQFGPIEVTAEKEKTIWFPPMLGGASLVAGITLVIISVMNKNKK